MKKIMFNDKFGLTQAVLEGRKTMTRRIVPQSVIEKYSLMEDFTIIDDARYNVGDIVAIAQSYESIYNEKGLETMLGLKNHKGWQNKLFVAAGEMIHHIRITDVKVERLQDISDEDCLREGINASNSHEIGYGIPWVYEFAKSKMAYYTPRDAFAALIDKVSGKGTWESNPFVFAYEFRSTD